MHAQTLTFLFADLEGSTKLAQDLGHRYVSLLERYHEMVAREVESHSGDLVGVEGDGHFATFTSTGGALEAAIAIQRATGSADWPGGARVKARMGVHVGEAESSRAGLVGIDIHRAARIAGAAHGGQILTSARITSLSLSSMVTGFKDLGLHRLKDIADSERLYQVKAEGLVDEFPPPNTLRDDATNLPLQLTSFLGREEETAAIEDLVRSDRLVTITGPGGAGKSRLALHVADRESSRFTNGVWLVRLVGVTDVGAVPAAIATATRIDLGGTSGDLEAVAAAMRAWRTLLVLDNCEHLLPNLAPAIKRLLELAMDVRVIVTSRVPLGVQGERIVPVPPLPMPSNPEEGALKLLRDRARQARPGFDLTETLDIEAALELVRQLDGLPLAIELAAARLRILSIEQLTERLSHRLDLKADRPDLDTPHHETLLRTIAWSSDLLDSNGQAALKLLSVFEGSFDLGAADAVLETEALDVVEELVAASLLMVEYGPTVRFRMLLTVRAFASGRLANTDDEQVAYRRHGHHYARVLTSLSSDELRRGVAWLADDRLDIVAALDRALAHGDTDLALSLAAGMTRHWYRAGLAPEASPRLEQLASAGLEPSARLADVVRFAAVFRIEAGLDASQLIGQQEAIAKKIGAPGLVARSINIRGGVEWRQGRFAAAASSYRAAIAVADDDPIVTLLLNNLGSVLVSSGRLDEASEILAALGGAEGNAALAGDVAFASGDLELAVRLHRTALDEHESEQARPHTGSDLLALAEDHLALGDVEESFAYATRAIESLSRAHLPFQTAQAEVAAALADPAEAASFDRVSSAFTKLLDGGWAEGVIVASYALAKLSETASERSAWMTAATRLCEVTGFVLAPDLWRVLALAEIEPGPVDGSHELVTGALRLAERLAQLDSSDQPNSPASPS